MDQGCRSLGSDPVVVDDVVIAETKAVTVDCTDPLEDQDMVLADNIVAEVEP